MKLSKKQELIMNFINSRPETDYRDLMPVLAKEGYTAGKKNALSELSVLFRDYHIKVARVIENPGKAGNIKVYAPVTDDSYDSSWVMRKLWVSAA